MKCRSIQHLLFLLVLVPLLPFPVQAQEKQEHPVLSEPGKAVGSLPWTFKTTRENLTGKGFPYLDTTILPEVLTGYRFISTKPVPDGNSSGTYLRISFYSGRFSSENEARKQFQYILDAADQDTGLSYQWDHVSRSGMYIFHFHADCLLSQKHFSNLVSNFAGSVVVDGSGLSDQMYCRCGGGCRTGQGMMEQDEVQR